MFVHVRTCIEYNGIDRCSCHYGCAAFVRVYVSSVIPTRSCPHQPHVQVDKHDLRWGSCGLFRVAVEPEAGGAIWQRCLADSVCCMERGRQVARTARVKGGQPANTHTSPQYSTASGTESVKATKEQNPSTTTHLSHHANSSSHDTLHTPHRHPAPHRPVIAPHSTTPKPCPTRAHGPPQSPAGGRTVMAQGRAPSGRGASARGTAANPRRLPTSRPAP